MNQSILNRPRIDKFNLVLDVPRVLKGTTDKVLQKIISADCVQFTVFGSPVPALSVPGVSVPFGGQNLMVSSHARPPYPPLKLDFLIDNGYQNYWVLWKWLNLFNEQEYSTSPITTVVEPNSKRLKNPIDHYITSFTLYGLDEYNNKIISFKYSQAFITSLGEINFTHQDSSHITGSATFAYNQMLVELLTDINTSNC